VRSRAACRARKYSATSRQWRRDGRRPGNLKVSGYRFYGKR
jgi:hypothetical protein